MFGDTDPICRAHRWQSAKESACLCRRSRRHRFDPWIGKIPRRKKWQPTPVCLPGKLHGQRSLMACWCGQKDLEVTERLSMHTQCCVDHNHWCNNPLAAFSEASDKNQTSPDWGWNADLYFNIRGSWDWLLNIWTARERGSNEKQNHPLCRSHRTIYSGRPHWPQPNVSVIGLYVFFGLEKKAVCLMMLFSSHFNWSGNRTTVKEPLSSISILDYSQQAALARNGLVLETQHLQV